MAEIDDFVALKALPLENYNRGLVNFSILSPATQPNNQKECAVSIYVYVCITTSDSVTREKKRREREKNWEHESVTKWETMATMRRKVDRDMCTKI